MRLALLALVAVVGTVRAQTEDSWKKLEFLLGDWAGAAGEKDTPMGSGQGSFSFQPELNRKIVVRRNTARYGSGAAHDDLMVIYLDSPAAPPRAIYFDSEGHVIHYSLTFPAPDRVVFESDAAQPGPRYRLTYWREGGSLQGRFEIRTGAEYQTYLSWTSKKR